MPFPNEHSCRMVSPKEFDRFRRVNNHHKENKKPVDVIFGIKEGKSKIQAYRYRTKHWSANDAKSRCKSHGGILFEPASKQKKEKSNVDSLIENEIDGGFLDFDDIIQFEASEIMEGNGEIEITFSRENGKLLSNEILLAFDREITVEHVEDGVDEGGEYSIRKFELIDNNAYNCVYWPIEAIEHQYNEFIAKDYTVSHGLDHSWRTLDQLGPVTGMELVYSKDGSQVKAIITSKHYKRTEVQQQAQILFEQELLNFISGGWQTRITLNEDEGRFEVVNPVLREASSTPVPAKTNARRLEQTLGAFKLSLDKAIPKEELEMSDEPQTTPENEGAEEQEHTLSTPPETPTPEPEAPVSREEFDALKQSLDDNLKRQESAERADLIKQGVELGLDEKRFEGLSNTEIANSITLTKEAVAIALRDKAPEHALGGPVGPGGKPHDLSVYHGLENGTQEMAQKILETEMPWLLKG